MPVEKMRRDLWERIPTMKGGGSGPWGGVTEVHGSEVRSERRYSFPLVPYNVVIPEPNIGP